MERSRIKSDKNLKRSASAETPVKKRKRERSSSSLHSSSSREKKMTKKKNKHSRSSSSDSSSSVSSSSSSPSRGRKKTKKRKHKHSRSSSSFSDSSSSSRERKKKKRKKKKKHKHKNKKKEKEQKKMSDASISSNIGQLKNTEIIGPHVSMATIAAKGEKKSKSKAMRPMTKEEWEKQQSVVRRVYDQETGRNRLVKGDGEILEEIVNKEQHREINKQATRGDGLFFQAQMGIRDK
ncbi:hypothetical protein CHS0354_041473 [Potamilus streckersoni]|uniref:ADP-ribosylation factor-like protein 6-interacting protein 4 n=1 Tax=Potamilus streckersoni TaxID=2493646 RepID=A0AAE0TA98_9BIVA|nr:hypothetical protein CHS0354_041473 [Potamilus streckersoni]